MSGTTYSGPPHDVRIADGPLAGAQDFDALAELFLGERERPPSHTLRRPSTSEHAIPTRTVNRADPAERVVDLVVAGHLPVRAAPWVSQYAMNRSETCGEPVALLRLHDSTASVDLFGSGAQARAAMTHAQSLDDGIDAAGAIASAWIVHVDDLSEVELATSGTVHSITLLSGANKAAVVEAYRTLKSLASARQEGTEESSGSAPELRVAIMGASDKDAGAALERINRAAEVFLHQPVSLAATIARMRPAGGSTLFRGHDERTAGQLLDLLHRAASPQRSTRQDDPTRTAEQAVLRLSSEREPEAPEESPRPQRRQSKADQQMRHLATHLDGLHDVPIQCPDVPEVQLAVDDEGRLHLLTTDQTGDGGGLLLAAAAWARKHMRLLAMALVEDLAVDASRQPRLHLFTADPKAVRPMLDADIHLHLLTRIDPQRDPEWFCADLN